VTHDDAYYDALADAKAAEHGLRTREQWRERIDVRYITVLGVWHATLRGDEEGYLGEGRTEADAMDDLIAQVTEDDE
jgi:hypothetical protein